MDVSFCHQPLRRLVTAVWGHNNFSSSFCTVLDGAKSGMTILPERYRRHRNNKQFGTQFTPQWKMVPGRTTHQLELRRRDPSSPFVMDFLQAAMEKESVKQLKRIDEHFSALRKEKDPDLIAPWRDAEAGAEVLLGKPESEERMREVGQAQMDALKAIKTHVERVCEWCDGLMKTTPPVTTTTSSGGGGGGGSRAAATTNRATIIATSDGKSWFTTRSIERRQDRLRRMSHEFVSGPPAGETWVFGEEEVARLRASYAYLYDWERKTGGTRFPWNVAMRELGLIKLRARKDFKPISQEFYEKMSMRKL
jgi:RNA-dependent RNA polymerase